MADNDDFDDWWDKQMQRPETVTADETEMKSGAADLLRYVLLKVFDVLLTLALIILPIGTFGAYWNFLPAELMFGILYAVILSRFRRIGATKLGKALNIGLRVLGAAVIVFYYGMIFHFYDGVKELYPVIKTLYVEGNFGDSDTLDFLPDKIPDKAENYHLSFIPPMAAPEADGNIDVYFYTDEAGVRQMRETALEKKMVLLGENDDRADTDELLYYFEQKQLDADGAEIYYDMTLRSDSGYYAISEKTGLCVIYWVPWK